MTLTAKYPGRCQRDLTLAQFLTAAQRHGWTPDGFAGHFKRARGVGSVSIWAWNAGQYRRAQLAYLIAIGEQLEAE